MHQNTIDKINLLLESNGSKTQIEFVEVHKNGISIFTNNGFLSCSARNEHDAVIALLRQICLNGLEQQVSVIIAIDRVNQAINSNGSVKENEFRIRQRYRRIQRLLEIAIIILAILAAITSIYAYLKP
jgi:hypothetical protein